VTSTPRSRKSTSLSPTALAGQHWRPLRRKAVRPSGSDRQREFDPSGPARPRRACRRSSYNDAGYQRYARTGEVATRQGFVEDKPHRQPRDVDRSIFDTLAAMFCTGPCGGTQRSRSQRLRWVAWLPELLKKLDRPLASTVQNGRGAPAGDASASTVDLPYIEDDFAELVQYHLSSGSSSARTGPHAEGMSEPAAWASTSKRTSTGDRFKCHAR